MDHFVWNASPEIFSIGFFAPRWYGLMFALGFFIGMKIMESFVSAEGNDKEEVSDLLFWTIIATIVGARLGHVLFYQPDYYLSRPLEIFMIWKGGLASHGGFLAVLISWFLFSRYHKSSYSFLEICDRASIPVVMVAGLIRIGNFFNSEIVGIPATVPWAVVFQKVDMVARHPAQLYESFCYLTIFIFLLIVYKKTDIKKTQGRMLGLVLVLTFSARLIVEYWKENQVLFENGMIMNMGQLLSIPFILTGLALASGLAHRTTSR